MLCHRAAMTLQRSWLRFSLFGHARRTAWPNVRDHLRRLDVHAHLWQFACARREWRSEPHSWILTPTDASVICVEATEGLWGSKTTRWK